MWFRNKHDAVVAACRLVQRECDAELLMRKAKEMNIALPITTAHVSAPSLGGTSWGHQVAYDRLVEFRSAVDQVIAAGGKKAA